MINYLWWTVYLLTEVAVIQSVANQKETIQSTAIEEAVINKAVNQEDLETFSEKPGEE